MPNLPPALATWLLDSDPAIRWQVLRDLLHAPLDQVLCERARIDTEGWGAQLLALQNPNGQWSGKTWSYPDRTSTFDALALLAQFRPDPTLPNVANAIDRVRQHVDWGAEWNHSPFFEGEVEPCINGRTLAIGSYFLEASDELAARLISEQLQDGGWNCQAPPSTRSSFHSTLCVLEGLLAYQQSTAPTPALTQSISRGIEYLLHRRLLRTASTGTVINLQWTLLAFPSYWHYDILWALDFLRRAGHPPDPRMAEAIQRVESKRTPEGHWLIEHIHPGQPPIPMEGPVGTPSRWLTLRALRVLNWYHA